MTTTTTAGAPATDPRTMRRVAISVLIGTTVEWYDFILYGSAAALVFGPLFFPSESTTVQTLLSFSTFAVGFGARPLGGIILGHVGDRIGRKRVLFLSLMLMGIATFLIGVMPTYDQIGLAAPLLLVLLRLVQGFGVGGEWGGAVLTSVEFASPGRRGLYGSLPQMGVPLGLFTATAVFFCFRQLPEDAFMSWGWRIPFLLSVVLVGIGLFVRSRLEDTPAFTAVKERDEIQKVPVLAALRRYPRQIALATGSMISTGAYFYVVNTYALSYAKETGAQSGSAMLIAVLISALVAACALPVFGAYGQRHGRRRTIIFGLGAMIVWIFPTFLAVDTGNPVLLVLAYVVGALFFSVSYGPQATFITELFDASVRFTASSLSFQIGVLLGGAIAPIVATSLFAATDTSMTVAAYVAVLSLLSLICVAAVTKNDLARGSADMGGVEAP
ncbi:MFS transporter [Nocardioides sp. LHG3406-4]|uniref:MFS transporter n=1 Tax=Nocardioides sp. LHG3406-4 TaxID=2804575 RepID=UPI003CE8A5E4